MGEEGGEEGARSHPWHGLEILGAWRLALAGVTVEVALARAPRPLAREEVAELASTLPSDVRLAALDAPPDPCEAALALLYSMEDEALKPRIRDPDIRFLANIVGARQASEALRKAGNPTHIVVAGVGQGSLKRAGINAEPAEAKCTPEALTRLTEARIERL